MTLYYKDDILPPAGSMAAIIEFYQQGELVLTLSVAHYGIGRYDRTLRVTPRDGERSLWLGTEEQAAPLLQWLPAWYEYTNPAPEA